MYVPIEVPTTNTRTKTPKIKSRIFLIKSMKCFVSKLYNCMTESLTKVYSWALFFSCQIIDYYDDLKFNMILKLKFSYKIHAYFPGTTTTEPPETTSPTPTARGILQTYDPSMFSNILPNSIFLVVGILWFLLSIL